MHDDRENTSEAAAGAITRRIMMQRVDLLAKFGPEKVMAAIDDKAADLHDLEEIGSSDVSIWVEQVAKSLEDGDYDHDQHQKPSSPSP